MHHQVVWVLSRQAAVAFVVAVVAAVVGGPHAAVSALLGGVIAVASASAYAWRAMRASSTGSKADPRTVFGAQVSGEGLKFAVTLALFALVFKLYGNVAALPLFLAYAATHVVYWAALLKHR